MDHIPMPTNKADIAPILVPLLIARDSAVDIPRTLNIPQDLNACPSSADIQRLLYFGLIAKFTNELVSVAKFTSSQSHLTSAQPVVSSLFLPTLLDAWLAGLGQAASARYRDGLYQAKVTLTSAIESSALLDGISTASENRDIGIFLLSTKVLIASLVAF